MTYLHNSSIAILIVVLLLVVGGSMTMAGRRRRRTNLIYKVVTLVAQLYNDPGPRYDSSKIVQFNLKVDGFEERWRLYFDAGRKRFTIEHPTIVNGYQNISLNKQFALTPENVGGWVEGNTALQAFTPSPPGPQ